MLRVRSVSEEAAVVEADMRREYQLHPWEALALPATTWVRYVSGLSGSSVTAMRMAAKTAPARTVVVDAPPTNEAEHRQRLSALRGYRT